MSGMAPAVSAGRPQVFGGPIAGEGEELRAGIWAWPLYGRPGEGPAAAFLRYAPGASTPWHRHSGSEHIWVLEGIQEDLHGSYRAGTLVVYAAGSSHSPSTRDGCLVLVIWEKPVIFETPG